MRRRTPSSTNSYDPTPIRFVGADSDFMYWVTHSWSRTRKDGKVIEYDISLDKRDGLITCTCPDAQYRGKTGDVLDLEKPHKCKHVSKLCHTLGGVLTAASPGSSSFPGGGCAGGARKGGSNG